MKRYLPIAVAVASIVSAGQVMAKEMDMSKVTCKEVGALPAGRLLPLPCGLTVMSMVRPVTR